MSNFWAVTLRPDAESSEKAEWMDDYFGLHRYGVRFEDGEIYPESEVQLIEHCEPPLQSKGE